MELKMIKRICNYCNHFIHYEYATRDHRINKINACGHPTNYKAMDLHTKRGCCGRWEQIRTLKMMQRSAALAGPTR